MNISLKQLEIFVAVVECGNFTEAGRKLYLAQSSVSSHISSLEEILHVRLFHRETKRSADLTADGKRVYECAKDVLSKCAALEPDSSGESRRCLTIGASTVPSKSFLPRHILCFTKEHPECYCVIRGGNSESIQQMVLDGDIQIGFVGSTDNRQALTYERVAEDRLVLITPNTPYYAQLKEQGVLGRELLGESMVFRDQGSGTQRMIDNYLSTCNIDTNALRAQYYTADPELQQELVALGAGVSIQSALSVADHVQSGKLLMFELEKEPVYRHIYMVFRKDNALSELAKSFADQVRGGSV